jgi:hypothetical protein
MVGSFLPKKLDFNILLPKNIITLNNPSPNKKKKPKIIKKKQKNQFSEKNSSLNPNLLFFFSMKLQKHPNCIHLIYGNTLTPILTIVIIKIIKQFLFFLFIIF